MSRTISVHPARLRRCYGLLVVITAMAGGWIWFGNAGVALMTLWCAARPPWQQEAFFLTGTALQFTVIEPWRIAFRDTKLRDGVRKGLQREVFRDEVSAADWTRLRRQALAASSQRRG